jgi:hypothetical protein
MNYERTASALALAVTLSIPPSLASAGQSAAQFHLSVDLQTNTTPNSAFCHTNSLPGAFGATVTIVCSTGVVVDIAPSRPGAPLSPMHGGAYRYLTQVAIGGQILGTVDIYSGLGTITSWRVVNLVDRQYVEMTLNW